MADERRYRARTLISGMGGLSGPSWPGIPGIETFRGKAFHFLWVHPALLRKIIPAWLDFFRPSFHPWDEDNRAALARLPKLISEIEAYAAANGEAPSPSIRRKLSTTTGAAGS